MAIEISLPSGLTGKPSIVTQPRKYVVEKNKEKIQRYLVAFKKVPTGNLEKDTMMVAKNMATLKSRFDAKKKMGMTPKNFEHYESTEMYDDALEAHFDEEEAAVGFEGWEGDMDNFLPALKAIGGKVLKVATKSLGKFASQGGATSMPEQGLNLLGKIFKKKDGTVVTEAAPVAQASPVAPVIVHDTLRKNVLHEGLDAWLTDKKRKEIDRLIAKGKNEENKSKIKAQLVEIGVDPRRFKNFEDEEGNFSGKAKDVIDDILSEYKKGEVAKGTNEAMPKIIIAVVFAFGIGWFLSRS